MADWGPWVGDRALSPALHAISPSASAHTKGSWVASSDTGRGEGFVLHASYLGAHTTARTVLVDVGVGSPQEVLIANLMLCPAAVGGATTARECGQSAYFPVQLPSGALALRAQSSMASHETIYAYSSRCTSGTPCIGSVVDTYGADTVNSKGTTLTAPGSEGTFGAWAELTSSSQRMKALMVAIGHGQAAWTTHTNQWFVWQIGIGPESQEQIVISAIEGGASSSATGTTSQMIFGPYYVDVPPGTRISARVGKQYSADQRTIDLVAYGIR